MSSRLVVTLGKGGQKNKMKNVSYEKCSVQYFSKRHYSIVQQGEKIFFKKIVSPCEEKSSSVGGLYQGSKCWYVFVG